jgi:hypothetical protein
VEPSLRGAVGQNGAYQSGQGRHQGDSNSDGEGVAHAPRLLSRAGNVPRVASFRSIAPILPTADVARMQADYERLGFVVHVHQGGYATAARDGINLHFRLSAEHDRAKHGGAVYISVDDADALHAEWLAAGVGEVDDLWDPGFGVWESALTDADGNVIRFGSPVAASPRP